MRVVLWLISMFCTIIFLFFFGAIWIGVANQCDHEKVAMSYAFQFENSTADSYYGTYCKECKDTLQTTRFRGYPDRCDYLYVLEDHSDTSEILSGRYYTIQATVILKDHDTQRTRIQCKVESEDVIVNFSVEFRDEFEELVSELVEGDIITFYGRFYQEGCGFKDCMLVGGSESSH